MKCAHDKGFDVVGIEPNEDSVKYAREVYKVKVENMYLDTFIKGKEGIFDVISMFGLLDLVPHPMTLLKQAYTALAPNGILAVSLPNYDSLSTAVQATYNEQIVVRHMYPIVLNMFTLKSAEFALKKHNFEIEALWFFRMDVYEMLNNLRIGSERL